MKKLVQILTLIAVAGSMTACISVSESGADSGKQIAIMSQQATATCGPGNVDKVTTTSFTCKSGK